MQLLIDTNQTESEPFSIPDGQAVTLQAMGLQGTDKVSLFVVATTEGGPRGDVCCPGPVVLPTISERTPLADCNCSGTVAVIELTAAAPWVELRRPIGPKLVAVVETDAPGASQIRVVSFTHSR